MYGAPTNQQYQQAGYNYAPPGLGQPSTSTSLQALSHAALAHPNPVPLAPDRPRTLLPAPGPNDYARPATSEGGRSVSPAATAPAIKDENGTNGAAASSTKGKQTRKRGRKRIEEDPAAIEANDSLDADAKRKLQNRAAQRAFRERKERHVIDLEEKVVQQEAELAQCRDIINQLRRENEALRRGENPAPTPTSLPNANSASPPDVKPALEQRLSNGASPSFHHILNADAPPPPAPVQFHPSGSSPPVRMHLATSTSAPSVESVPPQPRSVAASTIDTSPSVLGDLDLTHFDSSFDFDAPFDFSESMALPPLFASLLDDLSLPPSTDTVDRATYPTSDSTKPPPPVPSFPLPAETVRDTNMQDSDQIPRGQSSTLDGENMDADDDDDDDDPPPLPLGRIPCDKPECDFTAVSCALPIPWRPPNAPRGSEDKDLWIAQKCWAKLVSHPLFDRCDPDELCQELRDKTRCSDDGRLVCHKKDVSDIFRNIPQKAKLKQLLQN